MDTFFLKILWCIKCRSENVSVLAGALVCSSCNARYPYENEKVFFTELPKNARRLTEGRPDTKAWSISRLLEHEYFKDMLQNENTEKVFCDIGPGTSPYHALTSRFKNYVGIDFFPYRHVGIVSDITKPFPLRDKSCDIVFVTSVLEHVPNPEDCINEIHRILKPGGYCIGSVPFLHPVHYAPYDFYRYTNFALERFFNKSGFSRVEIKVLGNPADIYKTFQDRFFSAYALSAIYSSDLFIQHSALLLIRCVRKIHHLIFFLFSPLYRKIKSADDWVLAYCFKAVK